MNPHRLFLVCASLSAFLSASCRQHEYDHNTGFAVLDSLLSSTQVYTIEVGPSQPGTVAIVSSRDLNSPTISVGSPVSLVAVRNRLYVADSRGGQVLSVGPTGTAILGRSGAGPGEFSKPSNVKNYRDNLVVFDVGNRRIQVYRDDIFVAQTDAFYVPFAGSFATDSRLILVPATGFDRKQKVVEFELREDSLISVGRFFPSLGIPPEGHAIHNEIRVAASNDLRATAYYGLPFVFVLDDHAVEKAFQIRGPEVAALYEANSEDGPRTRDFFSYLALSGDSLLLGGHADINYLISVRDNRLLTRFRVRRPVDDEIPFNPQFPFMPISDVILEHDSLLAVSRQYGSVFNLGAVEDLLDSERR